MHMSVKEYNNNVGKDKRMQRMTDAVYAPQVLARHRKIAETHMENNKIIVEDCAEFLDHAELAVASIRDYRCLNIANYLHKSIRSC